MKNLGIAQSSITRDIEVDLGVPRSGSLSFSENLPGASPLDLQSEVDLHYRTFFIKFLQSNDILKVSITDSQGKTVTQGLILQRYFEKNTLSKDATTSVKK